MLQFDCLEAGSADAQPISPDMSLKDTATQTEAFIFRFPSMCRGLLEMQTMDEDGSSALDPYFPPARQKLVFTHRSGYDFVQTHFVMPPNSDMKFDATQLILRSICRVVEALPWCEAPSPRYNHYNDLIDDAIHYSCFKRTRRYAESHFASLRALEGTLLRKQHAIPDNTPFGPSLEDDDIRIDADTISVIPIASLRAYDSYVKWALKKYPPWFATKEAKAWALRQAFHSERPHGLYSVSYSLLCADESGWFSINETIRDEGDKGIIPGFSLPLSGSVWLHFVVFYIVWVGERYFEGGGLRWMLELGAEARVRFEWWSEELSPERQEQVRLHVEECRRGKDGLYEPIASCWVVPFEDLPLGSDFGMTITVGDDPKTKQLIQGPQWPEELDTRLIRGFVTNFGKASGNATLRDFLELTFTPTQSTEEEHGPNSLDKDEVLQTLDDAMARVEAQSQLQAQEGEGDDHDERQHGLATSTLFIKPLQHRYQMVVLPSLGFVLAAVIGYILRHLGLM